MIKLIAAIDDKHGVANDHGIPWQGKLPTDIQFFRDSTIHSTTLMGWVTYTEFNHPLSDRKNFVLARDGTPLHEGFQPITDLDLFLANYKGNKPDLWVIGGAGMFAKTISQADELYLTRVIGDFGCTKFFPPFEHDFVLGYQSNELVENDIPFRFEVWKPRPNL